MQFSAIFILTALALGIQAAPSTPVDLEARCGLSAAPVDKRACDFYYAAEVEKRCGPSAPPNDKRSCDEYFLADVVKRSEVETRCGPSAGPIEKRDLQQGPEAPPAMKRGAEALAV
ncbi:hypothetical protein HWV62_21202 [Athelia sp. TMB]|nr:hypothetical protein HWV62_21202 [Athelia sp. TMB]